MRTPDRVTRLFGIEHPIFAFTHCREVVAAVSRAGGMGVYGAATFSPERVDVDLKWISENCGGRPFGVDVMMPLKSDTNELDGDVSEIEAALEKQISQRHRDFVAAQLERFGVPPIEAAPPPPPDDRRGGRGWRTSWNDFRLGAVKDGARLHVEVALSHPIAFLVSALGPFPAEIAERARHRGVKLGALVGSARHAKSHVKAGVDVIIAQGAEAAAHTGEIGTMVLIPEVVDAVHPIPVLAAGGIGSGRQLAAAYALGAQGVWTGSIWLAVAESDEPKEVVDRILAATSGDTLRSACRTGKPLRQLRTEWAEAWEGPDSPGCLPMPTQHLLTADAEERFNRHRRGDLMTVPIGQIAGSVREVIPAERLLKQMVSDCDRVLGNLGGR